MMLSLGIVRVRRGPDPRAAGSAAGSACSPALGLGLHDPAPRPGRRARRARRRRGRSAGVAAGHRCSARSGRVVTVVVLMAAMAFALGQAVDRFLPNSRGRRARSAAVGELLDRAAVRHGRGRLARSTGRRRTRRSSTRTRRSPCCSARRSSRRAPARAPSPRRRDDVRAAAGRRCRGSACATCRRWRSGGRTCCSASSTPASSPSPGRRSPTSGPSPVSACRCGRSSLLLLAVPIVLPPSDRSVTRTYRTASAHGDDRFAAHRGSPRTRRRHVDGPSRCRDRGRGAGDRVEPPRLVTTAAALCPERRTVRRSPDCGGTHPCPGRAPCRVTSAGRVPDRRAHRRTGPSRYHSSNTESG